MSEPIIRCAGKIYGDGRGGEGCSRKATVTSANGRSYCKQHLPENVKARNAATRARWDAESAKRNRIWDAEALEETARRELLVTIREGRTSDITVAAQKWSDAVSALEKAKADV